MQNRINTGQGMRIVTIKKEELLAKLRENRATREKQETEATEEYRKIAQLEVKTKLNNVKKQLSDLLKKLETDPVKLYVDEDLSFDISPPESHLADYDEIILMFEMEVSDTIELNSLEFSQYVMNKWDFNRALENTRTLYASKQLSFSAGASR